MFSPTDNRAADTDLATLILTAPIWLLGFAVLVIAGAVNDWEVKRG